MEWMERRFLRAYKRQMPNEDCNGIIRPALLFFSMLLAVNARKDGGRQRDDTISFPMAPENPLDCVVFPNSKCCVELMSVCLPMLRVRIDHGTRSTLKRCNQQQKPTCTISLLPRKKCMGVLQQQRSAASCVCSLPPFLEGGREKTYSAASCVSPSRPYPKKRANTFNTRQRQGKSTTGLAVELPGTRYLATHVATTLIEAKHPASEKKRKTSRPGEWT